MKSILLVAASVFAVQGVRLESSAQEKLYKYIQEDQFNLPADESLLQWKPRRIYDADGDGVEDNTHKTYNELDDFYWPNQFGVVDEINNTHHGNLPGHVNMEWDLVHEVEPKPSSFMLTKDPARIPNPLADA